ncbi:dTDP-4-dehydrorhamnose reductase [Vandammella animalimorsus]|uniref:dTDP-4-dehydrorhamnose reductase n=1 Tax=Vandammella animalimorsus TaxID=2029117 RepID=A0A2A2AGD3_9BURK|nr:dTDP-4-dehydrorhamnose reductase [Vandammella animalimorsus]PAT36772.1 dTDP-4-dehydrorhamnose reductase [Vandammella animalimorsus]
MKILLLGKNGQVGWELQRSLAVLGEVIAPERSDAQHGGDLAQPEALRAAIRRIAPQAIVNAAAYTAVDRAQSEAEQAHAINTVAPQVLAQEASALDAWLVHYSTDYVFDGSGQTPWRENDATAPLSVYGQSKLAGEQAIAQSGAKHLILRTSWVYGAHGNNFLKTMLRLGAQRPELRIVADQIGAPTGAELLADATAQALLQAMQGSPAFSGIYHLTASGATSWFDYAQYIFEQARRIDPATARAQLVPIPSSEYPTPAARPLNSRLDTTHFEHTFGLIMPPWQQGVARVVAELLQPGWTPQ